MAISVESLRSSQPDNKSCDLEYGAINNVQQSNDIINVLVFNVQSRLLKNRPLYLELTKVEFTALLLRALGPTQVSSSFVDSIFDEIDVDKNGSINAEEITKCLYHVKPNKLLDKARFVSSQMFKSKRICGILLFLCSSVISISNNVAKRNYGHSYAVKIAADSVTWLAIIASVYFVISTFEPTYSELMTEKCISKKLWLVLQNVTSLGQIICIMWLAGSIAYAFALYGNVFSLPPTVIAQLWIVGGSCYLAGGTLAILCAFKDTFEKISQIQDVIVAIDKIVDDRSNFQPQEICESFSCLDDFSHVSVMTDALDHPKLIKSSLHRRMRSDHHIPIIGNGFNNHRRTPSSPAVLIGLTFPTINEDDTLQSRTLFDTVTPFNVCGGVEEELNFLGKDILVTERGNSISEHEKDGYAIYTSIGRTCDFDTFVHVLNGMVNVKTDRVSEKIALEEKKHFLFLKTCKTLLTLPSFYTSVLYAIAGAFFTIGALNTGLSGSSVQNLYLLASCLYLCGSACSLHQAIIGASQEWNLSQSSRYALQKMVFFDKMTDPLEVQ